LTGRQQASPITLLLRRESTRRFPSPRATRSVPGRATGPSGPVATAARA
jgi:hypothetical protein